MLNQFIYLNFEADCDISLCAQEVLDRIEAQVPPPARMAGKLEKVEGGFWAKVDAYSRKGVFSASTFHEKPEGALLSVEEKMKAKIELWKSEREVIYKSFEKSQKSEDRL